jgi:hypothetical protein
MPFWAPHLPFWIEKCFVCSICECSLPFFSRYLRQTILTNGKAVMETQMDSYWHSQGSDFWTCLVVSLSRSRVFFYSATLDSACQEDHRGVSNFFSSFTVARRMARLPVGPKDVGESESASVVWRNSGFRAYKLFQRCFAGCILVLSPSPSKRALLVLQGGS